MPRRRRATSPDTEAREVVVKVPGPLVRRLARLAPEAQLESLCVTALGEIAAELEQRERRARLGEVHNGDLRQLLPWRTL
jgi:hypothetical protein